jgi:hypothetical protein
LVIVLISVKEFESYGIMMSLDACHTVYIFSNHRVPGQKTRREETTRKTCALIDNNRMDLREADMDCIYLAQDRDQWRALVNTVMSLPVP